MIVPRFVPSISLAVALAGLLRGLVSRDGVSAEYARQIRTFFGTRHVVLFPQARIALYAIVRALLPRGSEVIVSAYNVPVVIEYLEAAGARLEYVDIEEGGFNMDVSRAIEAIGENTRAIVVSHMYGRGVDFADLVPLCREKGILIIEDAAQAFGSSLESRDARIGRALCGTVGDIGVFSTGIYKKFSTLLGGFVVTDDTKLFEKIRDFKAERCQSRSRGLPIVSAMLDALKLIVASNRLLFPLVFSLFKESIRSINTRDDKKRGVIDPDRLPYALFETLQSRLGIRSFPAHERTKAAFVENAAVLWQRLAGNSAAGPSRCEYLHYPVLVPDRRAVVAEINALGYDLGPGKFFNYGKGRCPIAERAVRENLSLPIHRFVTRDGLERMADVVEKWRKGAVGERERL